MIIKLRNLENLEIGKISQFRNWVNFRKFMWLFLMQADELSRYLFH